MRASQHPRKRSYKPSTPRQARPAVPVRVPGTPIHTRLGCLCTGNRVPHHDTPKAGQQGSSFSGNPATFGPGTPLHRFLLLLLLRAVFRTVQKGGAGVVRALTLTEWPVSASQCVLEPRCSVRPHQAPAHRQEAAWGEVSDPERKEPAVGPTRLGH